MSVSTFGMYLSVQKQEEAKLNSLFNGLRRGSLCALCALNTVRRCWITSLFVFVCLNWWGEFVRSGAGGCEGRRACYGVCVLSVRRCSVCAPKNSTRLHPVLECFKLSWKFKLARLKKHMQLISFRDDIQHWPANCPDVFFGWPRPVGWNRRGILSPYNHIISPH